MMTLLWMEGPDGVFSITADADIETGVFNSINVSNADSLTYEVEISRPGGRVWKTVAFEPGQSFSFPAKAPVTRFLDVAHITARAR